MSSGRIHEPFREEALQPPSERSTGLVLAAAALIAAFLLRGHLTLSVGFALLSVLLAGFAMISPSTLAPLNRAWFRLALIMNRFVSPIVMFILYAVVIVPSGLIMQRLRDPLQLRGRGQRESYWIERSSGPAPGSMRDQF